MTHWQSSLRDGKLTRHFARDRDLGHSMQVHGGHSRSNHSRSFQGVCVQNLAKRLVEHRITPARSSRMPRM